MTLSVKKDMLVTLHVRMADMSGKVLEETGPEGITYLHGHGDIFPKIEKALEGRFQGEGFVIKLEPEEAFGQYDSDAIEMVPVKSLGDPETIVPGLVFEGIPGRRTDGRWRVTDVADGMAVLETNHPLAGLALQFEIKVLKIEPAPSDEDAVGNDSVVVPSFISVPDKIVDEGDEEDPSDEEMDRALEGRHAESAAAAAADDTPMGRMASKPPRIIR